MIDDTLKFMLNELNGFLESRFPNDASHAVLSGLANQDGTVPEEIANKIVITLVNIERENAAAAAGPRMRNDGDKFARINPPLNINLYLLVSASFDNNYPESFKLLSAVLGFFQATPAFTAESAPGFPPGLEKVSFELVNLDFQALNNLWSNLGGKYLPSVVYKARMLTIQEGWILEQIPPITGTGVGL